MSVLNQLREDMSMHDICREAMSEHLKFGNVAWLRYGTAVHCFRSAMNARLAVVLCGLLDIETDFALSARGWR